MPLWAVILTWIGVLILFLVGVVGIVAPVLPGIGFIYAGILLYAIVMGLDAMPLWFLIIAGILTAIMLVVDYVSGVLGAKGFGASKWGVLGAFIGLAAGVILGMLVGLPFVGLLLGPLVGAVVAELIVGKTKGEAMKAGFGTFIGFLAGTAMKVITGLVMIFTFLILTMFY